VGCHLLDSEQSFNMRSHFLNLAARADAGLLQSLTDESKLKFLRKGECPMCQPFKNFLIDNGVIE
jgi:hypothetical protein